MNLYEANTGTTGTVTGAASKIADVPSLKRSLLTGGFGFCLASVCVFATVAFAERWMYNRLGLPGAYLTWTALFILLGGGALSVLVVGPKRLLKFYMVFALAFFAYALGWISAYFILRGSVGEWIGSIAGSVLMSLVVAAGFGALRLTPGLSAILFIAHSVGYFLGSTLNDLIRGKTGMILWGAIYGFCLGAGLGAVLHLVQKRDKAEAAED